MSERKITAKTIEHGAMKYTDDEMLMKFEDFLKYVERDEYSIVPSKSAFADYIGVPRAEIHSWCSTHPSADKQMQGMFADTIASGAMLKKYVPNITSFALKNWCGWEEAPQKKTNKKKETADENAAKEKINAYLANERRKAMHVG